MPEQILLQFLGLGGRMLLIGLPIGLVGAWFAGRAMTGLLFGVAPGNPLVLAGTAGVLAAVALLACVLPSRRAARIAPTEALRGN
jgi:ABC-type antimicrobial peptide transport system permease subunit